MDDAYPWLNGNFLILLLFVVYRLINHLFRAGYFRLGQISRLSLAEKAGDGSGLYSYLNDPLKLNLCSQLFDKVSLLGLIATIYLQLTGTGNWGHLVAFFTYLALFDLLLPTAVATFIPEWLVTRLFPLVRVPYALGLPIALLMCRMVERQRASDQNDLEENPEDVKAFLRAGAEEGIIEEKEKPLLHNLLNFNDTVVREVMTPRTDMICVEHSLSKAELLGVFRETKFSRLPVYRDNIDMIEGLLRYKDVVDLTEDEDITPHIKQILFVPEQKNISDLLQEMLKKRLQMAVVIDEFGGTAGLITLEDLIEEIVGEIHDEHETPESDEIIPLQNGSYLVDGKVLLDDFAEMFSIEVEDDDVDTIGGYIFNFKGHIPKVGETCEVGGRKVEITKADDRRIYQVLVSPEQVAETTAEPSE